MLSPNLSWQLLATDKMIDPTHWKSFSTVVLQTPPSITPRIAGARHHDCQAIFFATVEIFLWSKREVLEPDRSAVAVINL